MEKSKITIKFSILFNAIKVVMWAFVFTTTFFAIETNARYLKTYENIDIISFVGDCYPSESTTMKAYLREGGINNIVHSSYKKIIDNSDVLMANLECAISDRGEAYDKQYTFKINPEHTKILSDAGIDIVTIANNHSYDFGEIALRDTIDNLKKNNILYVGAGDNLDKAVEPVRKEINGRTYLFYSASIVAPTHKWFATKEKFGLSNGYSLVEVCNKIKFYKEKEPNAINIVYMHWGDEKEENPNDSQMNASIMLADAGADLIVGAHPHIFQKIDYYKGIPIVYSLGNFIYGESASDTLILDVIFDYSVNGERNIFLKIHPGTSGYEMVRLLGYEEERLLKVKNILKNSPMCVLDEQNLYIRENLIDN